MLKAKTASLSALIGVLFKIYQEIHQQTVQKDQYRIIDVGQNKDGQYKLTIQVANKRTIFSASPEQLMADDSMMEFFSKKDIRAITYYACQSVRKPRYQILFKEFCGAFHQAIFFLKSRQDKKVVQKTAAQISLDKNMLSELDPKEAHLIGYMTALEKNRDDQIAQKEILCGLNPQSKNTCIEQH